MTSGFYITLPSNTLGKNKNEENTLASYTTKLAKPVSLRGDWEIALVEIIYPFSFYNVRGKSDCGLQVIELEGSKSSYVFEYQYIPPGFYYTPEHLLQFLNECLKSGDKLKGKFEYSKESGHVQYTSCSETNTSLVLSSGLKEILGFSQNSTNLAPNGSLRTERPMRLNLFVPDQLFNYSDLVGNEMVGDTLAPLLRTIVVDSEKTFGTTISKTFDSPHYVKLARNYFDSIDINIRNSLGEFAPFQFGTVTCKVHLRPSP